ncbi:MAG: hypothetical protein GXP13_10010 [Gammaproteobacteria bacterium]|nr:hypothetical protein [Gammaproteobacteria bacterium]
MKTRSADDIQHELERAIFLSLYQSTKQRFLRLLGIILMTVKHGVRGLLYVWPLTLLLFVDLPGYWQWAKLILLILAAAAWTRFIYSSVKDDYLRFLHNRILEFGKLHHVL